MYRQKIPKPRISHLRSHQHETECPCHYEVPYNHVDKKEYVTTSLKMWNSNYNKFVAISQTDLSYRNPLLKN